MNNGWIPLRRGLLDHIVSGNINASETATFVVLLLKADASTGKGFINAAMLRAFYTEMSKDTSQRALASLEEKGFIWRENPTHSKRAYPYWVNKFECTRGPNHMRITDLSQVFQSKRIKDIKYIQRAHETKHEMQYEVQHEMQHEMSDSYNKDTDKDTDTDKTTKASSSLKRTMKHSSDADERCNTLMHDRDALSGSGKVMQVPEAAGSSSLKRLPEALPDASAGSVFLKPLPEAYPIRWQPGEDCGWFRGSKRLDFMETNAALIPMGLEYRGGKILEGGVNLPWEEAIAKIEGTI